MRWVRDYVPEPNVSRLYKKALLITVTGNVFLAVAKGLVAYYSKSVALYADAANSVSDVVYSLLMVFGLWAALRPPDLSHPQGHSRFEPLVGLMVALSMGVAGIEAVRAAVYRLTQGPIFIEPGFPAFILLLSALVKGGMFLMIRNIAAQLASPTLATTAKDNLSDVLTSIGAFAGALGSTLIHPWADPVAGFLVAGWIFRSAILASKENLNYLTGAGASADLRKKVVEIASAVPGVQRVHHTMTEYVGPRLVVDLHVNVSGKLTVEKAHQIEDEIVYRLEQMKEVDRAYVHIEPEGYD